jgi:hypothetical protein
MTRRYWRAKYNHIDYCGLYHRAPPPQPEKVQKVAEMGAKWAFRYFNTNKESVKPIPDLPYSGGGELVMSLRAAEVLLPLISPWTTIQSDVLVDGKPSHVLAIVTQTYDAMNTQTTVGRYHDSGIWLDVKELHLIDSKIGPSPIFRVPTTGVQWDHFLSEEAVNAIRAHELTGLILHQVIVE